MLHQSTDIAFASLFVGIELLEFKASVIAASALLSAAHELFPIQYPCFRKAILNCSYVNKVNTPLSSFMLKFIKTERQREREENAINAILN